MDKGKTIEHVLSLLKNAEKYCVDGQKQRARLAVRRRLLADLGEAYREAAGADAKRVVRDAREIIEASTYNLPTGILRAKERMLARMLT